MSEKNSEKSSEPLSQLFFWQEVPDTPTPVCLSMIAVVPCLLAGYDVHLAGSIVGGRGGGCNSDNNGPDKTFKLINF